MFFFFSKAVWAIAAPGNALLCVGFVGMLLLFRERTAKCGRRLLLFVFLTLAGIAGLPLGSTLLAVLEDRFLQAALPDCITGIVVLGGAVQFEISAERRQATLNDSSERIIALAALARRYPQARIIYSGYTGLPAGDQPGGFVLQGILNDMAIPPTRVLYEGQSRNTYENGTFSKALVHPAIGETWVLVTSARHMPRSIAVFRAIGWPVLPYPVDYRTRGLEEPEWPLDLREGVSVLETAAYEWQGLVTYRLTGRTHTFFPRP